MIFPWYRSVELILSPPSTVSPFTNYFHPSVSLIRFLMHSIGLVWLRILEQESNWCFCHDVAAVKVLRAYSTPSHHCKDTDQSFPSICITNMVVHCLNRSGMAENCWTRSKLVFLCDIAAVKVLRAYSTPSHHWRSTNQLFPSICITAMGVHGFKRCSLPENGWTGIKLVILPLYLRIKRRYSWFHPHPPL